METVDYKRLGLKPGDYVLDLGCGEGRHVISAHLDSDVHAFGVDLSLDDLATAAQKFVPLAPHASGETGFALSCANALNLPFADDTFDKVICSEVLEHIEDWRGVLAEIERVLKPGGSFCASVPRSWPEKICWAFSDEYHGNEGGHLRIFDAAELRVAIESCGFHYYHRHWAHALHSPFWWLKCLFWQTQDSNPLVKQYHRLLVWDIMDRPWLTRTTEKALNPIMGKSVVMYFHKEKTA
jgi:ubiquinone/menaquinone biosynthesis C-methylase UbiE